MKNPRTSFAAAGSSLNRCNNETMPVICPTGQIEKVRGGFADSAHSRLWTGGILLLACGAMLACGWPGGLAGAGGLTDG
jgi:hypothetical protein